MIASTRILLFLAALLIIVSAGAGAQPADEECVDLAGTPPGLYVTVDQSQVYLVQGDEIVELDPGEAAYANESGLSCLKVPPKLLDWPCGTAEALSLQKAATYPVEALPLTEGVFEVVRRYFEDKAVIGPPIEWLNGEYHRMFDAAEISELPTSAYWYLPGGSDPFASPKRPEAQLIALFWSTKQAVLDGHTIGPLQESASGGMVPVVFVFNEDNEVPVSFFGPNVTLKELIDAYFQRGIKVAEVPVWYAGDHHLVTATSELEQLFDIPDLGDIDPAQRELIAAELIAYGFTNKPLAVSILEDSGGRTLDQPERVRVAASLGIEAIPTVIFYYSGSSHLGRCGVPLPQVSPVSAASEAQQPTPVELPAPERKASDS
jgi:hypothetical protein